MWLRRARALQCASPAIASQRVLRWNLNQKDAYPHRISDPHLQQAPWFPLGRPQDLNPCRLKALVFGSEIPDLNPEGEITSGSPIADTGDF